MPSLLVLPVPVGRINKRRPSLLVSLDRISPNITPVPSTAFPLRAKSNKDAESRNHLIMFSVHNVIRNFLFLTTLLCAAAQDVVVETTSPGTGPPVTKDKTRTPSGWSTRKEDGAAADQPFEFQPGVNLIKGWTEGVLQMKEGERALLHVPSKLGYGASPMGSKGGAFYIPANSDLLFDIEVLSKAGAQDF